jgi:ABC-type antimicrobial peptide transport system permease subunit
MFSNALKALIANKLKTFLIFLSFTFSITAIFLICAIATGIITMYSSILKSDGDMIVTQKNISDTFFSNVDTKLIPQIENIKGITKVSALIFGASPVENLPIIAIYGTSQNRFSNYKLISGSYPQKDQTIVGSSIYKQLQNKKTLLIGTKNFTISGVYQSDIGFENGGVVLNLEEASQIFNKSASLFLINTTLNSNKDTILKAINNLSNTIEAKKTTNFIENYNQFTIIKTSSNVISFIAFAMGLLAIASIMSITVNDRKDEFGIKKALGISSFKITSSLIIESFIVGVISFITAFIVSNIILIAIKHSTTLQGYVNGEITLELSLYIFITSIIMSALGVLIPSLSASKIDPIILIQKGNR